MALARALIMEARSVLLLDEPLSALDPFLRVQMRCRVAPLAAGAGLTFVHVTHSQEEAMALADLMVVMNHGRIEQAGPREVYNRPASEFVARASWRHNVIDTPCRGVAIRSDRMAATPTPPAASPTAPTCPVVTDVEYQGTYVLVGLQGGQFPANAAGEVTSRAKLPLLKPTQTASTST